VEVGRRSGRSKLDRELGNRSGKIKAEMKVRGMKEDWKVKIGCGLEKWKRTWEVEVGNKAWKI
jgi:hypothetical protein